MIMLADYDGKMWLLRKSTILYLRRDHLTADRGGQFLLWHEIGHVADTDGLSTQVMDEWYLTVKDKFKAAPTYPDSKKQLRPAEIWADQWAMWATSGHESFTTYQLPDVMTDRAVEKVLEQYQSNLMPYETANR
jgi:hypothetical protein